MPRKLGVQPPCRKAAAAAREGKGSSAALSQWAGPTAATPCTQVSLQDCTYGTRRRKNIVILIVTCNSNKKLDKEAD